MTIDWEKLKDRVSQIQFQSGKFDVDPFFNLVVRLHKAKKLAQCEGRLPGDAFALAGFCREYETLYELDAKRVRKDDDRWPTMLELWAAAFRL